jgi:hypothetical protein
MMSLVAALSLATSSTNRPPADVGQCKWVHGRFLIANGSSVQRIWVIGTRRIIALYDDDKHLPAAINRYESSGPSYDPLYGDFYVCALEQSRPGWMQHVRLLRTRNLIFKGKPYRAK